jgi:hypothetical protein
MSGATLQRGEAPADTREWWHVLGKLILCVGLLAGAGPPFLFDYLLGVLPLQKHDMPALWLPLAGAPVAFVALMWEVRFARPLIAASYFFFVAGPLMAMPPGGGPLHGGELVVGVPLVFGLLSWCFAVPGLLMWRRKDAPPRPDDETQTWRRPGRLR